MNSKAIQFGILCLLILHSGCKSFSGNIDLASAKIPSRTNQQIDGIFSMARIAERNGQSQQAIKAHFEILEANPNYGPSLHRMGVMSCQRANFAQAMEFFDRAVEAGESSSELMGDIGYALYLQGDVEGAIDTLRLAAQKDPADKRIINNLAVVVGKQKNYSESLNLFRQAGSEAESLAGLAFIQSQTGMISEAKSNYHRALELDSKLAVAANGLVELDRLGQATEIAGAGKIPEGLDGPNTNVAQAIPTQPMPKIVESPFVNKPTAVAQSRGGVPSSRVSRPPAFEGALTQLSQSDQPLPPKQSIDSTVKENQSAIWTKLAGTPTNQRKISPPLNQPQRFADLKVESQLKNRPARVLLSPITSDEEFKDPPQQLGQNSIPKLIAKQSASAVPTPPTITVSTPPAIAVNPLVDHTAHLAMSRDLNPRETTVVKQEADADQRFSSALDSRFDGLNSSKPLNDFKRVVSDGGVMKRLKRREPESAPGSESDAIADSNIKQSSGIGKVPTHMVPSKFLNRLGRVVTASLEVPASIQFEENSNDANGQSNRRSRRQNADSEEALGIHKPMTSDFKFLAPPKPEFRKPANSSFEPKNGFPVNPANGDSSTNTLERFKPDPQAKNSSRRNNPND